MDANFVFFFLMLACEGEGRCLECLWRHHWRCRSGLLCEGIHFWGSQKKVLIHHVKSHWWGQDIVSKGGSSAYIMWDDEGASDQPADRIWDDEGASDRLRFLAHKWHFANFGNFWFCTNLLLQLEWYHSIVHLGRWGTMVLNFLHYYTTV